MKIEALTAQNIGERLDMVADFRLRYFREYPYLYEGDRTSEAGYLADFMQAGKALLLVAMAGDGTVCGVATACCLKGYSAEIDTAHREWFKDNGYDPERFCYVAEMIIAPEHRKQGLWASFREHLEKYFIANDFAGMIFMTVERAPDDPRRPAGYYEISRLWKRLGFRNNGCAVSYEWPVIQADGSVLKQPNKLSFWYKIFSGSERKIVKAGASKVEHYYDYEYDEWARLDRHKLEFGMTKRALVEFLKPGSRILDVGGGPGRYSIWLAQQGHAVTLFDLSAEHIAQARQKAEEHYVLLQDCIKGNALELDKHFATGQFDAVLCMGPLYHLLEESDRRAVIRQCLDVLRPGGIFVAAFISAYAPIVDVFSRGMPCSPEFEAESLSILADGRYSGHNGFTEAYFIQPDDVESLMAGFPLEKLCFIAVESLGALRESSLNELPEAEFEKWLDFLYRIAGHKPLLGASEHLLYIGRKN